MKYAIRTYVDTLFKNAPEINEIRELKEEILSDLEERYNDCIADGMSPQRAYTAVIGTMGDVNALIEQISSGSGRNRDFFEKISIENIVGESNSIFRGKYSYIFTPKNLRLIKIASSMIMWIAAAAAYFGLSFIGMDWHFTQLAVFIITSCIFVRDITGMRIGNLGGETDGTVGFIHLFKRVLWFIAASAYYVIGVFTGKWGTAQLSFLFGAIVFAGGILACKIALFSRSGDSTEGRLSCFKDVRKYASVILWLSVMTLFLSVSSSSGFRFTWIVPVIGAVAQILMYTAIEIQINRYKRTEE